MKETFEKSIIGKEPVAIIGMACRFPGGATSPDKLWENLLNGVDAIIDIPKDRWDIRKFFDEEQDKPGKMYVKQAGFLKERIDQFDPMFFGMSPREADVVDPMQKILLEVSWEAFEDAGITSKQLKGSNTGVFIGGFALDNKLLQLSNVNRENINSHTPTSSTMAILSNRISYAFNLHGPSVSMDTACSSSVVAAHYAVNSLRAGDCEMAVVGGANIMIKPEYPVAMCKGHFLSHHGRCKAFDADAAGYTRAEGAGIIILKPLSLAKRDGDRIDAVIVETGVNQDGQTSGISLPNPEAQEELTKAVYDRAGVAPEDLSYIEAHGTGTKAGDPIEVKALANTLKGRGIGNKCFVGSIKTNIGHLEAAAGVAGIMKAALTMKHKTVAPNLHFNNPNPEIPFDDICLAVPTEVEKLDKNKTHFAGVNSFGYGGTNGHVLLRSVNENEKIESKTKTNCENKTWLIPISAKSESALKDLAMKYHNFLKKDIESSNSIAMEDFAYTVSKKRSHHKNRLTLVVNSKDQIVENLKQYAEGTFIPGMSDYLLSDEETPKLTFVLTGMGPQWWEMGRELMEKEPVFKMEIEKCDKIFRDYSGWSIMEEMLKDEEDSRMTITEIAQPANFVIQVALAKLWEKWGVKPDAVIGHSVGEVSAAYLSGALSLEDGILVIYHRSRLQQATANNDGAMLAVGLSEENALELISDCDDVSIAAINSGEAVTLSGNEESLKIFKKQLGEKGIFNRFLKVEVAYHSYHMDPIENELKEKLSVLKPKVTHTPLYSTVTGKLIDGTKIDANYWWSNARGSVRFADGLKSILKEMDCHFLEIGPHPVLKNSIKEGVANEKKSSVIVQSLNRKTPEIFTVTESLGKLYTIGVDINWDAIVPASGEFIKIPTYAWQHDTYWHETERSREIRLGREGYIYFNESMRTPHPSWEVEVNRYLFPYLEDHKVENTVIFPGAGYADLGLAMHDEIFDSKQCTLENLEFHNVLAVNPKQVLIMHSSFNPVTGEYFVHSKEKTDENGEWKLHASGKILENIINPEISKFDFAKAESSCPNIIPVEDFYAQLKNQGLNYGPFFKAIKQVNTGGQNVLVKIEADPSIETNSEEYLLHPTILDASFQSMVTIALNDENVQTTPYVPVNIERINLYNAPEKYCWSYGKITKQTENAIYADITIFDQDGNILAEVHGLKCQAIARAYSTPGASMDNWFYEMKWDETEFNPKDKDIIKKGVIVFGDNDDFTDTVLSSLRDRDIVFALVKRADSYYRMSSSEYQVRQNNKEDMLNLFKNISDFSFDTIIDLWSSDYHNKISFDVDEIIDHCMPLTNIIQALQKNNLTHDLTIVTVTRGGQAVEIGENNLNVSVASLLGLGQLVMNEHPNIFCRMVDLDFTQSDRDAEKIITETLSSSLETDIAYRDCKRFTRHLAQIEIEKDEIKTESVSTKEAIDLDILKLGQLDTLLFRKGERIKPDTNEVEIKVHSSPLNFKDLLKAYGQLDQRVTEGTYFGNNIGMEVSGTIVAVGEDVGNWKIGDEVATPVQGGAFKTYVTVSTTYVIPKPSSLKFEEATNFIGYLTSYYGLIEVGRLKEGEKVLIHNATGGVGVAAIQVAQSKGAEIFTTAGTDEKRKYLNSLGIEHIFDSRSLKFYDEIKEVTNGYGVDVVLNAQDGDALWKSFSLLAPYGRFIEIGKKDISLNSGLPMRDFNRNLTFSAIDIDRMFKEKVITIQRLLKEIGDLFKNGTFKAGPVKVFPANEVSEAFRFMSKSKHIGKIVVTFPDVEVKAIVDSESSWLKEDSTYLITGGTSGFGLAIASWLSEKGAKKLVLLSRSGAKSEEAKSAITSMKSNGTEVIAEAIDVKNESQVKELVKRINLKDIPLRGVFHGAMVLDDDFLVNLNRDSFKKVFAPKVAGAWNLHKAIEALEDNKLDIFAMFSSISSLIGNNGQGNYVAANAFLDNFARFRRSQGLTATTINWGVLAETGVVARNSDVGDILEGSGIKGFSTKEALSAMSRVLENDEHQIGIFDIDWQKWTLANPKSADSSRFYKLVETGDGGGKSDKLQKLIEEITALDNNQRQERMENLLKEQLAKVLRFPSDKIDVKQSISELGVDSLMTLELSGKLQAEYGIQITSMELLNGPSISQLADQQLEKYITEEDELLSKLDDLTEEELDKLLNETA